MKYKMICIDLDGTLLEKKKSIGKETKEAIKLAHSKGIKVVITTGRLYNNALQILSELDIEAPVIAENGAIIKDEATNSEIYRKGLSTYTCKKLLNLMSRYRITAHFYTDKKVISNSILGLILARVYAFKNQHYKYKIDVKFSFNKYMAEKNISENEGNILKCVVYSTNEQNLVRFKNEVSKMDELNIFDSGARSFEINAQGVSKGQAVKILSECVGIDREDIICIGDNYNDISMIEYAGLGVAMGNAIDILKKQADYVTDSNTNDGVGKVIKEFMLT